MLKTGLEFAPGTTDACKQVVGRMFKPADLLEAYRTARAKFGNGDIVLAASSEIEGIQYAPRFEYAKILRERLGPRATELNLWHVSAQSVMKLPPDSSAFWLIIDIPGDMPIMCVIFAVPYETGAHVEAPVIQ